MLGLFSKYLLIGLSAITLLAGAQQSLAAACDPSSGVDPDTWSLIEEWECEPGNPGVKAHKWACFGDDGTPQAIKYTDGVSDTGKCPVDTVSETPAVIAPAPEVSAWECERALLRGENICNDNITFCEATGWQGDQVVSAVLKSKEQGVCDPSHGERDSRGCIFQYLNVRGFNYSTPQAASLFGAASACPAEVSAPAQAPAAPAQAPQPVQCVVCDQGKYRLSVMCTNPPTCDVNNPNQGVCVGAAVGQECPPPAAGGASATGGSATGGSSSASGGSSTVTITNPTTTREVVREVRVVAAGNVGVGATVLVQPVVQGVQVVTQLPKTGLPALAWTALAFVPTGFGLKRFSKIKKALENHPQFIFEERQFKAESVFSH